MLRKEAISTYTGKYAVLARSEFTGAWLCGPLTVTSDKPWRLEGPIVCLISMPEHGVVPKDKPGNVMHCGGANAPKVVYNSPEQHAAFNADFGLSIFQALEQSAQKLLDHHRSQVVSLEQVCCLPDCLVLQPGSSRNIRRTRLGWAIYGLTDHLWVWVQKETELMAQAQKCLSRGLISSLPPAVERLERETADRKMWRDSLSKVTVGATERV